eukprot:3469046-Pyramimonas_sp.AAC.1
MEVDEMPLMKWLDTTGPAPLISQEISSVQFSSACAPAPAERSPEGQAGHKCTACVEDCAHGQKIH